MTPDFKITANSNDITTLIRDRLIRLSITDETGWKSDAVEIELDDRDGLIELPNTGAELKIALGYKGAKDGLSEMGLWVVDEPELVSPPAAVIIKARAAIFSNSDTIKGLKNTLKEPRTQGWENVTLGDVVNTIATRHGFTPRVGDDLASTLIARIDQSDESDMHLLTRLAKDYGAIFKPANSVLLFIKKSAKKSASGKQLKPVVIRAGDESSYRVSMPERGKYKAVVVYYYDTAKAKRIPVRVGDAIGKPVKIIREDKANFTGAFSAAESELKRANRGAATLRMTLPGNPHIAAETPLTLEDYRQGVSGEWVVTRATHEIRGKYTTTINAEASG